DLREFFGGDAFLYDQKGVHLVQIWLGHANQADLQAMEYDPAGGSGWGMYYLTGFIYLILGRNILAAQSLCAVVGAATAPMVFFCARKTFNNLRVAKLSALAIAVFPSFVMWSSQL